LIIGSVDPISVLPIALPEFWRNFVPGGTTSSC